MTQNIYDKTCYLMDSLRARERIVATAESCTGGLVSSIITDVAGSSEVFDRGFITYSNDAKNEMLGVSYDLLDNLGAVSEEVARAMAAGAIERSNADLSVAITGIAGPGGATEGKPVGLVYIAVSDNNDTITVTKNHFSGDRNRVRIQSAFKAIDMLRATVTE